MIEKTGNVFDTEATYIGHGVNCVGVMGAGIAKTIRKDFPLTYQAYKKRCFNEEYPLTPGSVFGYSENGKVIINFATQEMPGADARYEWVLDSFIYFAKLATHAHRIHKNGNVIAIPEIGCGIGGLEWSKVKSIIEAVELAYPIIQWEVWHFSS